MAPEPDAQPEPDPEPDPDSADRPLRAPDLPPPLRRRPPRPWVVHWAIDAAVAFVAVLFLALLTGLPILAVAAAAVVVGAIAAPYTRRAEIRALAEREP